MSGSWRPVLRLARREILTHRWRSLLVLVLIGLPVMLAVGLATVAQTGDYSREERGPDILGSAAAQVTWTGVSDMRQDAYGTEWSSSDGTGIEGQTNESVTKTARRLGGAGVIPITYNETWFIEGDRGRRVFALRTDLTAASTESLVEVTEGRVPSDPNEVLVSPELARSGAGIGRSVNVGGADLTVVGIGRYERHEGPDEESVVVPNTSPAVLPDDVHASDPANVPMLTYLLTDGPVTAADVRRWNAAGFVVASRHLFEHPEQIPSPNPHDDSSGGDGGLVAVVVVGLVIEVVLLAGPAFAVGVRRQRRGLALLASAGGSPRDIRRTVLLQAVLLGLMASVCGAALGLPSAWLTMRVVDRVADPDWGPFDPGWIAVGPAIALGVLSAVLAALVPARQAAQADLVAALADRQPTPRVSLGWPILGSILVIVGTMGSLSATTIGSGDFENAWWAIVTVLGAVLLTPWLISWLARFAARVPLPLRLALRDSDRHRSRSAPAVAAVMASVSAVVAIGIASASDASQTHSYADDPWVGQTLLTTTADHLDGTIEAIRAETGIAFTPLRMARATAMWQDPVEGDTVSSFDVAIVDQDSLDAWGVELTSADWAALAEGSAIAWNEFTDDDGRITLTSALDPTEDDPTVPVVMKDGDWSNRLEAGVLLSSDTARRLDLDLSSGRGRALLDRPIAGAERMAVSNAAAVADPGGWDLTTAQDFSSTPSPYWPMLLALLAAGAFAVLLGTFSATALALDDARADMTTLSAVGSRPRTRRLVSGSYAFVIAFVGTVLGVVVGFTPGIVAAHILTSGETFVVPWTLIGVLVLVLPVVAGAVTALVSRTRRLDVRLAA